MAASERKPAVRTRAEAGGPGDDADSRLMRQHEYRLGWLEEVEEPIVALSSDYPDGHSVPPHRHSRCQLLYALSGVVLVSTDAGRWMVPPGHGIWIPSGTEHAVEMAGDVAMYSLYVVPGAVAELPGDLRVVGMTQLMRTLVVEAVGLPQDGEADERGGYLMGLILHEIPRLERRPLALPMPTTLRLARICRRYVDAPSPHVTIDNFADAAGMSRRSFTRLFHKETGLSLAKWRQQACLLAALPRLSQGEPVTSVALDLGYDSVPAFTTMFRRMTGLAPKAYLRMPGGRGIRG
jgi:AraC-like DNA-binding protein/quercetin dioxygenase-like cupin family protein